MKSWLRVVLLGVVAGLAASAVADNDRDRHKRVFRAQLVGLKEVPSVSSPARGQFYATVNQAGTAFTYWLSYSGLTADASQAHIHVGQHHVNGGIGVWLCQGSVRVPDTVAEVVRLRTPECASRNTGTPITATITAELVVGPAGQGIGPTEFAELLAAIRAGVAYANVHSAALPGGEIRGQID